MNEKLKLFLIFLSVAVVAVIAVVATVIVSNLPERIIYDKENDSYTVKSDGRVFYPIPNFEPVSRATKPTAVIVNGKYRTELYPIIGMDDKVWLCDEDGTVYRAGKSAPELSELKSSKIDVCVDGKKIQSIARITDADVVAVFIDLISETKPFEKNLLPSVAPVNNYTLRLTLDDEFKGLFYVVGYAEYENDVHIFNSDGEDVNRGKYIVCDDFYRRAYSVGTIIHEYVD